MIKERVFKMFRFKSKQKQIKFINRISDYNEYGFPTLHVAFKSDHEYQDYDGIERYLSISEKKEHHNDNFMN